MKGLAITNKGIEDVCAREIKDLIGRDAKALDSCAVFEFEDYSELFVLCYKMQSARKIMLLFDSFRIKDIEDIKLKIPDLSEWITNKSTFVARCWNNNPDFNTMEVEQEAGGFVIEKTSAKVDFKNPDAVFFVVINGNDCHIGIDFSGEDLGKRDYRLFTGSDTMKATVGYGLLKIGGYKEGDVLVDPFCFSGTVPIEAALNASGLALNYFAKDRFLFRDMKKFEDYDFDKLFDKEDKKAKKKIKGDIYAIDESVNAVSAAKKNAKIAGVNKMISFSRKETGWLELKFKEGSVDKIITHAPEMGRKIPEAKALKIYDELFWQAKHMLKKGGKACILTKSGEQMKNSAEKHDFKLEEERRASQGKEQYYLLSFEK